MRRLLFIIALLALTPYAWARQKLQDSCRQGGKGLAVSSVMIQGGINVPLFLEGSFPTTANSTCIVTVYSAGTTILATIYSDNIGTLQANPFSAASDGWWFFYANNGRYDVRFSSTTSGVQINSPFTRGDYLLCDPADATVPCGTTSGGSMPCTTIAAGTKDIIPQTCAGMWTLQNLTAFETTNVTLTLLPTTTPTQTVPNFYSGDPGTSFQAGGGDTIHDAPGYLSIAAGSAVGFNLMASLDPINKGPANSPMSDGFIVYLQQKTAAQTTAALETAIKGFYEKFDSSNDGAAGLSEGIAGKVILSGTGNMNQGAGVTGEIWNNGGGGSSGEMDALRAFISLQGTNTNVYGLKIENVNGQGCTRCFAWGYKGQSTNLPTSYLYKDDNLFIGASINTGGTTAYPATPKATIDGNGRLTRYNNAALTDGQTLIGDTALGYPVAATLTAGSGVTITNGAHSITIAATGSGGSVTSFSAGNLSPLFTTSVATPTTTPALTFSLSNAAGHTFFGNNTASSAAPAFEAIGTGDLPGGGAVTVNGQTCTLGSTCNVNVGATSGTLSVNNGNGSAITGLGSAGADYVVTATAANTWAAEQVNAGSSCGDATHAVSYSISTHTFGCQAISAGGGPNRLELLGDCAPTNGNVFYKVTSLTNNLFFLGHWEYVNGVDGHLNCHIHLTPSAPSTSVILEFAPITTSSGNVRLQISDACISPTTGNLDVALTAAAAQTVAITTTLFKPFEATFTPSCSTADNTYEIDIARIGTNVADTYTSNIALIHAWSQ